MQTLKFLNKLLSRGFYQKEALESLQDKMGIKFNLYPTYGLVVLNYDQIRSSDYKFTPIVKECRRLVLSTPTVKLTNDGYYVVDEGFNVVSRSFDRFFNLNEEVGKSYAIENMVAYEKLDGSLVMLFHHKGQWLYRTRSMIMPTEKVNCFEITWKELIEDAIGDINISSIIGSCSESFTHIFELTSPENRVVTRYSKRSVTLLAIRENNSGRYLPPTSVDYVALKLGWNRPIGFNFNTLGEIYHSVENLPNLEEGYVLYDADGVESLH